MDANVELIFRDVELYHTVVLSRRLGRADKLCELREIVIVECYYLCNVLVDPSHDRWIIHDNYDTSIWDAVRGNDKI